MSETVNPPRYAGPFDRSPSLGIDRAHYIALSTRDPEASARFAVEHMGLFLVHVDQAQRYYLAAHGLDSYSLVYVPGEERIDHISFVMRRGSDFSHAERVLLAGGASPQRIEHSDMWKHGPAIRFKLPSGDTIELAHGVSIDRPMAHLTAAPQATPGPITFDHAIVRVVDQSAAYEFTARTMGLRESSRIVNPEGIPVLGFFRAHTLYHCFGLARSTYAGLHHFQLALKDTPSVLAAYEKMKQDGKVELIWGPLRHGAGHNVAFYFHDYSGNIVEYSAEEEIILDDDNYLPLIWQTTDWRTSDEWNRTTAPWAHGGPLFKG
jgi:catechol 2,3-dioxygenase-like lactoylglutathione lyase family enzyme